MKEIKYKKIVKYKINAYAFKQLKTHQGQMKKGRQIDYGGSFTLQAYLKSNNILSLEEEKKIAYRSRMNNRAYNFLETK